MTQFYTRDANHPKVITKSGSCSRCHTEFAWHLLEPTILANQHIRMLCPSCRMDKEPTCRESDV